MIDFTRELLIKAIDEIDSQPELKKRRNSSTYDLIFENKRYPPILVLSVANQLKGGKELYLTDFNNNTEKPFQILRENNFIINFKEMNFKEELTKFLNQATTSNLKTSNYKKLYSGLNVKVSFGQGVSANIPWISFLREGISTNNGIYPVYLLFKKQNLLILAYGLSEENDSDFDWKLNNPKSIEHYLQENNLGKPFRYGKSYIYKVYNLEELPEGGILEDDLNNLIDYYKELKFENIETENIESKIKFKYKFFHEKIEEAGLIFSEKMVARFVASLCTKPFVICSGLSGSGKTKLAQAFVQWICESDEQYKIIPVGADWTNREPLLGFPNGLEKDKYVKPDSGALDIIIKALEPKNERKPFFLILDEMNLSHVERYFADFLSIMESKDKIKLYSGEKRDNISEELEWPKNLFIIGTVNIDETTYMFSPKVLDRANVIEFRISENDLKTYLTSTTDLDMNKFLEEDKKTGFGANMGKSFLDLAQKEATEKIDNNDILLDFFRELQIAGAEFGYRSASEINRLIAILNNLIKDDKIWDEKGIVNNDLIDIAIMQKLLPKIHGSRNKLTKILPILASFCIEGKSVEEIKHYFKDVEKSKIDEEKIKFKLSFEKICRMYKNAVENRYASYAEA